jgi:hypothetical protein
MVGLWDENGWFMLVYNGTSPSKMDDWMGYPVASGWPPLAGKRPAALGWKICLCPAGEREMHKGLPPIATGSTRAKNGDFLNKT